MHQPSPLDATFQHPLTRPVPVVVLACFCCFLWGSAFPGVKIGYQIFAIEGSDTASQFIFAGLRFIFAGILAVAGGSVAQRKVLLPKRAEWKWILLLMVFQTIGQYIFYYIGLAHTTGVKGAILISSNTFFTILVSCLIFRLEKLTMTKMVACLLGFGGVVILNLQGLGSGGWVPPTLIGDGCILLCALSSGIAQSLTRVFSRGIDPVAMAGWQFFWGGVIMSLLGLAMGGHMEVQGAFGWGLLWYLGFVSAAGFSLWALLLKYNPPSRIAVYMFTNPIFGVVLSTLLLDEDGGVSWVLCILALALVTAGIWVSSRKTA